MSVPFVGREDELRVLGELLATARRENVPAAGLIVGEPGTGKSRLLREVLRTTDARRTVLITGFEPIQPVPLAAAGDLIRRLANVPEVGPRLGTLAFGVADIQGQGTLALFEAAHRAHAAFGPLVLGLDDLQWLDGQSLSLVHYLVAAAESSRHPIAIVAASRPAQVAATFASGMAGLLPDERRAALELRGLPLKDGVALARAIDNDLDVKSAEHLWRQVTGSPFWLEALARGRQVGDPLEVVSDRLRALSRDAVALLNALVIAARPIAPDEILGLLEWPPARFDDALHELVGRGLALDGKVVVRVAHDLIREAALGAMPAGAQRSMHARLADHLERSAADDLYLLAEAMEHRIAAGISGVELAIRVASSPQCRLLGAEALGSLSSIADALPLGAREQQDLDARLGRLAGDVGEHGLAVHHWARLATTAAEAADRQRAHLEAARAGYDTSPTAEVHRHIVHARTEPMDEIAALELDTIEARVHLEVEHDLASAGAASARAVASVRQLVATAGAADRLPAATRRVALEALAVAGDVALDLDGGAEARELCDAVLEMSDGLGGEARISALLHVGFAFAMLGHLRDAEVRYREAWESSSRLLLPRAQVEAGIFLARVLFGLGRLEESRAIAAQSQQLQARVRPWLWGEMSKAIRHVAELALGVPGSLALIAADVEGLDPHYSIILQTQVAGWLAREDIREHAADVARALAGARSGVATVACRRCASELQAVSAEIQARLGHVHEATKELEAWQAGLSGPGYPFRDLWGRRARAAIEVASGGSAAMDVLASLANDEESEGLLLDAMWARFDLGRALTAAGDRQAAIGAYVAAVALAQRIGADGAARQGNRALRALGVRAWRRSAPVHVEDPLGGLSGREREVARLVGGGATNVEVADSLAISPKTVERHLTNILAKLGARNRTELAALIHGASAQDSFLSTGPDYSS